ncbi:TolB family protein [Dyadobacter tibetensis]|uniref:TolB family protein n=1 Tax=Dyadobacter tibetensis TaxID=1211851 RepID=UPI0004B1E9BB|nr:PD40 domain-containing protein [Dyadobacter tibetensis]
MKNTTILALCLFGLAATSCQMDRGGYQFDQGTLPDQPVNLTAFKTVFDDYNSTAPSLGELIPFCFSTNRYSQGKEFNIIYQPMNVNLDKHSGILTVKNEYGNWRVRQDDYEIIGPALDRISTSGNEFGPNLMPIHSGNDLFFTLMYSSDVTGNSQINYISNRVNGQFSEPKEVVFLNSEHEDLYPTFNAAKSKIYFCSDRAGEYFDFYYVDVDSSLDLETILGDQSVHQVIRDNTLSSDSDDKCPFIFGDKMVFASNRAGGFGGYDLYYSILKNGKWSEPVNFGAKINSEYDEFRPVLIDEGVSLTQDMMVFSSNRTGGKGGFDLYFAGIPKD